MDQTAAKAKVVAFRNRPDSVADKNDLAYAFGVDFASAYSTFGDMTKLNLEVYKRAVKHGLFEDQLQIDPRHASDFMTKFRREMMQQSMKVEEDKMKSVPYITTPSGLKYKVYRQGSGPKPTSPSDQVTVHYRGTLLNGTIFDSSYERQQPASFNLDQVIKGWTEGLMLMNVGSKFEFYIPSNLAYGPQGNRGIPGNSDLIFIVELLNVNGK
jgi:FKBP-type peptidyl-prolyl cis-trans isomerase